MSKLKINAIKTSSAQYNFKKFESDVITLTKRNKPMNPLAFSNKLREIGDQFILEEQKEGMNKNSKRLAETLVSLKSSNLAGRIYSYLIKFNKGNREAIEEFATNALAIAKRFHDPVHVMARANDLKEIYRYSKPNSEKLLNVLFDEKRALNTIIKDYEGAKSRYMSTHTEMKPVESYKEKLAAIKTEIGEILVAREEFGAAKIELNEALQMYEELGKGKNYEKIITLLKETMG